MDGQDLARSRRRPPPQGWSPARPLILHPQTMGPPNTVPAPLPVSGRAQGSGSAALSSSPQAVKLQEQEQKEEKLRLQQQEERRRLQEAELRRVEEEKERALGLQRKERELRERLLSILLSKKPDDAHAHDELGVAHADLLQPVLDILQTVSSGCVSAAALHPLGGQLPAGAPKETAAQPEADGAPQSVNGSVAEEAPCREGQSCCRAAPEDGSPEKRCPGGVLSCIPDNTQQPKGLPACEQNVSKKDTRSEQDKCNREPSKGRGRAGGDGLDERHKRERSRARRAGSREDDGRPRKERRPHKKHASKDDSPRRRSASPDHARSRRSHSRDRHRRERSRERKGSAGRKHSRHRRRSERSRSRSPSKHRSTWNR